MKQKFILNGFVTTAFVLNMQFLSAGSFLPQARLVNLRKTVEGARIGRLVKLSLKEEKKTIAKVKNIVV